MPSVHYSFLALKLPRDATHLQNMAAELCLYCYISERYCYVSFLFFFRVRSHIAQTNMLALMASLYNVFQVLSGIDSSERICSPCNMGARQLRANFGRVLQLETVTKQERRLQRSQK